METYLSFTQEEWSWYFSLIAGQLVHNPNRPDHTFTSQRHMARYKNKYRGRMTTNTPDKHGYALVRLKPPEGQRVVGYRHMVVWFLHHGWLPPVGHKILHLDGNKLNDTPENLAMYITANPTPNLLVASH